MAGIYGWVRLLLIGFPFLLVSAGLSASPHGSPPVQTQQATVTVLDRNGQPQEAFTDGDLIRLQVVAPDRTDTTLTVQFTLDGQSVASCSIPQGSAACSTEAFHSLGWHWNAAGEASPLRTLQAQVNGLPIGEQSIQVRSRPVVMVHGFISDWTAWTKYLGPEGYLAVVGIPGFAVGDGQFNGEMNTGSLDDPEGRTNTIQQNAEIIGQYIAQVKQATGAEMVDLLAHSMGGLIARYYIDRIMAERDAAQLIMLGSPMAGTECASLPASLGLYLPATLEIRPSYVNSIFNQQVTHRHGLQFHALAGNPILEAFKSPCTSVPTDLLVSQQSVTAIPLEFQALPILHTELNASQKVFTEFVLPLLSKGPGQYEDQPDPPRPASADQSVQFTRVFTGRLEPGQVDEVVIQIDEGVTVASFALYDTSRSLQVEVRGASGNIIELTAENNGLVFIGDPASLFYLGYGFENPRPGAWQVSLFTTPFTPPGGAAYALTAYMIGGVELDANALPLLPRVDEIVTLEAALTLNGNPLPIQSAQASVQTPAGEVLTLELALEEGLARATWQPDGEGLYGIDLLAEAALPDGAIIERTAFLSIQAQPESPPTRTSLLAALFVLLLIFLGMILAGVLLLLKTRTRRSG
jgi:pimeloyl-ACP methyl ester carboxylesterase